MRLEEEPRLVAGAGFFDSALAWARRVTRAFNPLADAIGSVRAGATPISATLDAPAFGAVLGADQPFAAATFTPLVCNLEEYDTNGCYDPAFGRFTPNVGGYYNVSAIVVPLAASGSINDVRIQIWKNGVLFKQAFAGFWTFGTVVVLPVGFSVPLNGAGDYLNVIGYVNGTALTSLRFQAGSAFSASLARRL